MINSTLCYLERGDEYLMLHRVKKVNDMNHDKWIGVGGKFEEGESPEDCILRETFEETGLTLTDYRYRGLVTFVSDRCPTEYMHLFTADGNAPRVRRGRIGLDQKGGPAVPAPVGGGQDFPAAAGHADAVFLPEAEVRGGEAGAGGAERREAGMSVRLKPRHPERGEAGVDTNRCSFQHLSTERRSMVIRGCTESPGVKEVPV